LRESRTYIEECSDADHKRRYNGTNPTQQGSAVIDPTPTPNNKTVKKKSNTKPQKRVEDVQTSNQAARKDDFPIMISTTDPQKQVNFEFVRIHNLALSNR